MFKERLAETWYSIARIICMVIVYSICRIRVYGRKNVPSKGPVLLLSNHQSFFDVVFCQSTLRRSLHFVARDSLFKIKIFGPLIGSVHATAIKRGQADLSGMKKVIEKLKQNKVVCLYPEATRTGDGRIAEIKPGFGLLSRRSGACVVPVVIDGAFECWPRHRIFPSFGRVTVSYGKVITSKQVKELGDKEFARVLTERLREMQKEIRKAMGKRPFDYTDND